MQKFIAIFMSGIIFSATVFAIQSGTAAQNAPNVSAQNANEPPSRGRAPKQENGLGVADVRVYDEQGHPLQGVYVHLTSLRSDGFRCESWGWTDSNGMANLPQIHMGELTFDINRRDDINKRTLKGYRKERIEYDASDLNNIIRVVLRKK